ncbi:MAG: orotidine-5'-phosphate decarboxylase [Eubacteriales bacterium]|nr:orotidine-5'-phosphate decarboxylase [Eubacteriales bacterium]
MNHFADRLTEKIKSTQNPTVMGLDPMLDYIPESLLQRAKAQTKDSITAIGEALFLFNQALIDATFDLIPAVKPQVAYYEQYGVAGLSALQRTVSYAQEKGMLVIVDAKRNDIGSTAEAYARAILGQSVVGTDENGHPIFKSFMGGDCITLNGYLGLDGIKPFLNECSKNGQGCYILVRTSNPSAGDLQDLILEDGRTVYEAMACKVAEWGDTFIGQSGYSSVGAVVGATWPKQAESLRKIMPHALILVPGYGAQGATADDAVASFGSDGQGAIVNASRSLMLAWKKHQMPIEEFAKAARVEAIAMRDDLQAALLRAGKKIV